MSIPQIILNSAEVWGLLIPLICIILWKPQNKALKPLIAYVIIALILNSIATLSWFFNTQMPDFLQNNNVFYNLHSIARVIFLTWFLVNITNPFLKRLSKLVLGLYVIFVLVNFTFFESIFFISTRLFICQSILLLFLYITNLLRSLKEDTRTNWTREPSFLVTTGVLIYEASTFFVWLFIMELSVTDPQFGLFCLDLYKIFFVIFCLFLTAAIYRAEKHDDRTSATTR